MALEETITGVIADLTSIAINTIAKKLGYSKVKAKQIEARIVLFTLLFFALALCFVTFKYG
jgi:hypothetical protein